MRLFISSEKSLVNCFLQCVASDQSAQRQTPKNTPQAAHRKKIFDGEIFLVDDDDRIEKILWSSSTECEVF